MTEKQYTIHSMIEGYEVGFDNLNGTFCELQKDGKPITYKECCDILNQLTEENKELKQRIKEETDRVIKLEQYVYTKLCPKSKHYDEKVLSEIINTILGDVE